MHESCEGSGSGKGSEASTGRRAYFLGKPNGYMFHRARRKLAQLALPEPEEVVMIGDTMETDIRRAVEAGLRSFLVLSGSTGLDAVNDYVYQPTRILNSIADLTEEITTGRPSDRLDSPALQGARPDRRRRYAHGPPAPAKHRPRPAMTR